MNDYPAPAVERAMKVQTVILKASSGQLQWVAGRRDSRRLKADQLPAHGAPDTHPDSRPPAQAHPQETGSSVGSR